MIQGKLCKIQQTFHRIRPVFSQISRLYPDGSSAEMDLQTAEIPLVLKTQGTVHRLPSEGTFHLRITVNVESSFLNESFAKFRKGGFNFHSLLTDSE